MLTIPEIMVLYRKAFGGRRPDIDIVPKDCIE
jgi:hypothetical protein